MQNSFNEMENFHSRSFEYGDGKQKVRQKISSHLGTMRFLGSIADVYMNRMVDTLVGLATSGEEAPAPDQDELSEAVRRAEDNGSSDDMDQKYPNL